MSRRRAQPEQAIQKAIIAHLKARGAKNLYWYSIPNGGARSPVEAKIMQSTGTRRGCPDLGFVFEGKAMFLEIKADNGRPTEPQLQAIAEINQAGGYACVVYGLNAALKSLECWGILRGVSS
jgi:hypothetical protein